MDKSVKKTQQIATIQKWKDLEFFSKAGKGQKLHYEFLKNFNSEQTRIAYYQDLKNFFQFYKMAFGKSIRHPKEIERFHIVAYKDYLIQYGGTDQKAASNLTVRRKMATLSSYFKFMQEKSIISINPVDGIKRPKKTAVKGTECLSQEQVKLFLDYVDFQAFDLNHFQAQMHRTLIYTLFFTGMRVSEIINIKYSDLGSYNGMMRIKAKVKGGQFRMVPIHPRLAVVLKDYFPYLRLAYKTKFNRKLEKNDYLFLSLKNNRNSEKTQLSRGGVYKILNKLAFKAGIRQDIGPHTARATLITSLLEQGVELDKVSHSVGHANIETTKIYDKRHRSLKDNAILDLNYD